MTSSPGSILLRRAAISSAVVPDVVRKVAGTPKRSFIHAWHFFVNWPSPQIFLSATAIFIYSSSLPVKGGILKSIIVSFLVWSYSFFFIALLLAAGTPRRS